MAWITLAIKALTCFLASTSCVAQSTSKNIDITNLNEHVKKMDSVLQELKSHSQAQEQKYSAVLSSVLSQLTQTTEELSASKNLTEELHSKVDNLEEELRNMKEINNNSLLSNKTELKQSNNDSLLSYTLAMREITDLKVELAELKASQHKEIGFEATLDTPKALSKYEKIIFDKVTHNEGNGYNNTTGYFTAPMSGTYLFWTNIVYRSDNSEISFRIQMANTFLGNVYGNSNETYGTASATTIFYLEKGESVWMHSNKDVSLAATYTSAGAVLIK